jgi:hypothetical protein
MNQSATLKFRNLPPPSNPPVYLQASEALLAQKCPFVKSLPNNKSQHGSSQTRELPRPLQLLNAQSEAKVVGHERHQQGGMMKRKKKQDTRKKSAQARVGDRSAAPAPGTTNPPEFPFPLLLL